VSYPQITDYQDAVQDPRNTFTDPELKAGSVAVSPLGLPMPMSGGFVLTYKLQSGSRKFAVRCFHHEVPQAQAKYAQISAKLRSLGSTYFVNFDFQAGGIRIHAKSYPLVKMDWVEGDTLGVYLDRVSLTPSKLTSLRQAFATLAEFLERNGIAHGDIQNENIIVSDNALRLIDYDGMFVTGMAQGQGSEIGHKHFQHPDRTTKLYGPNMDRFSFIVLDVSLEAMQADASLHRRFREGGQAIIFKANDFGDPSSSEVFRILNDMPALRESVKKLAAVCGTSVASVPTLSDFRAGRNIPTPAIPPVGTVLRPTPAQVYIGAFAVVDAKDFRAVLGLVGDKIELVGQIVSVKRGIGRRGRGRDRPFVFINFGIWNKDSVKITIWSEGLGNMTAPPTEAWAGKWISVTGLIEPPYEGKHYGKPYRSVGITVTSDNQIIHISEQQAKYRLGRGRAAAPGATDTGRPKNVEILGDIRGGMRTSTSAGGPTAQTARPSISPQTAKTRNEQILKGLQASAAQPPVSSPYSPRPSSPRTSSPPPGSTPGRSFLSRVWTFLVGR
jgi:serine/threonine protein kinase